MIVKILMALFSNSLLGKQVYVFFIIALNVMSGYFYLFLCFFCIYLNSSPYSLICDHLDRLLCDANQLNGFI